MRYYKVSYKVQSVAKIVSNAIIDNYYLCIFILKEHENVGCLTAELHPNKIKKFGVICHINTTFMEEIMFQVYMYRILPTH